MTDCDSTSAPNPADQPKAPGDDCSPPSTTGTTTPEVPKPPQNHESKCGCKCPKGPPTVVTCFDKLIKDQDAQLVQAKRAEDFKKELKALLDSVTKASAIYNQDKYVSLRDRWLKQDAQIAKFLPQLACVVKCWKCVIECYVCPLLKQIHDAEFRLYGQRKPGGPVDSLYDLRCWQERDFQFKSETFDRLKKLLGVWGDPAKNIAGALDANDKIISTFDKVEGAKSVFDVMFQLIPRHLAIAPPAGVVATKIDKKWTRFCDFDTSTPDDCCGPDVGLQTLRQRIVGPLPYLVTPSEYVKVVCCVVETRYLPAKDAAAAADAALEATKAEITRLTDQVTGGMKALVDGSIKSTLPVAVACCGDDIADDAPSQPAAQMR